MRLGSLFPQQKTLASRPRPGKVAGTSAATEIPKKANQAGPIPVEWPKVRPQKVKDYRPVTTVAELEAYLDRCQETGYGSFDWETSADEETRKKFELERAKYNVACQEVEYRRKDAVAEATEKERAKLNKEFDREKAALTKNFEAVRTKFRQAPLDPWKGQICTVSISAAPDESRVVPISHRVGKIFEPDMSRDEARTLVLDTLERRLFQNPKVIKIAVNLSFETKFAAKYAKYILMPVADPLVMWTRCMQVTAPQKIKDPKKPTSGLGLKPMTKEVFGVRMGEFLDLLTKHNVSFFDEIDASQGDGLTYSAEDADYGLQHYLYWLEVARQIPGYDKWLHEIEMPFSRVIGLMEYWGMPWDTQLAEMKRQEAEIMQEQAAEEIRKIAADTFGIEVNPGKTGKTGDVKHVLFDKMKIPAAKWSDKTKDPSLDEEAIIDMRFMLENKLQALDEEKYLGVALPDGWEAIDPEKDPNLQKEQRGAIRIAKRESHPYRDKAIQLLDAIQRIQTYSTLLSAHIVGREKHLNEASGRIHASYTPWTETSRLNSFHPNGQNVPRPDNDAFGIRNFFQARPGKVLFFIDFSGFELRLMAWRSGDETMIEIFRTGGDMHRKTAATVTGKPEDEVTKKERTDAKPANFGIAYGGTEHALQTQFKTEYKIRRTLDECYEMVQAVKKTYPRVPEFQKTIATEASDKGYVSTIYGYIRMLPGINSTHRGTRQSAERQAANTPIQGSAADVMKKCQNAVYDQIGSETVRQRLIDTEGFAVEDELYPPFMVHGHVDMIAQIHDEIIFEMDDDPTVVTQAMEWIKETMELPPIENFPVPIEAEPSVGYRWGDKMPIDKWLQSHSSLPSGNEGA